MVTRYSWTIKKVFTIAKYVENSIASSLVYHRNDQSDFRTKKILLASCPKKVKHRAINKRNSPFIVSRKTALREDESRDTLFFLAVLA